VLRFSRDKQCPEGDITMRLPRLVRAISISLVLLLMGCFGCGEEVASPHEQLTDIIASILATPSSFEGQQVTVIGYYRGWDILGEAKTGPPVTRSDWVIRDASGAIYVSASSEAKPNGLDPSSRDDVATILKLTGIVCVTAKGQPYLEATSIERVP